LVDVLYWFLNGATKGYFTWQLRTGAVLMILAGLVAIAAFAGYMAAPHAVMIGRSRTTTTTTTTRRMAQLTEADRYLLSQITGGDSSAWSQLVQRYQGRLLAFARGRMHRKE